MDAFRVRLHHFCLILAAALCIPAIASAQISSLVKDISPGANGSLPSSAVPFGNVFLFGANDGTSGFELWVSDGTVAGTTLLKDIKAGSGNGLYPTGQFIVAGSIAYFVADDGQAGFELWKTDGTAAGTVLVKDVWPGSTSSSPILGEVLGGTLYFFAPDGSTGVELWKSDGTAAGTVLVKDIRPGASTGPQGNMTLAGSTLYFPAHDGTSGVELWKSDGTAAGTVLVKDTNPGTGHSSPTSLVAVGSTVYFIANDGSSGRELWKSDGTAAGTTLVKDVLPGSSSGLDSVTLVAAGNTVFFSANVSSEGEELWKSDGTAAGTLLVKDINPGSEPSSPTLLTPAGSSLFFFAQDSSHGTELWKSDGTADGTLLVKDINPGTGSGLPSSGATFLTAVGGKVLFPAESGNAGIELWKSDGTERGTLMVEDLRPGAPGSSPNWAVASGSTFLVSQDDGTAGAELRRLPSWGLDTTPPSITPVEEGTRGSNGYYISNVSVSWTVSDPDSPTLNTSGCTPQSLSNDTPGMDFTCTVTSGGGTSSVTITLKRDTAPPRITCPPALNAAATRQDGANISYAPATATDDPNPAPLITYSAASGTAFPIGATSVTATATDVAGLSSTCSFTVNVIRDAKAPTLVCPANVTKSASSKDGALVSYPMASVSDELDPNPALQYSHASGALFPVGDTSVTVTARDVSGNTSSCSFTITVQDTSVPPPDSGCGCQEDPSPVTSWWMLLALTLWVLHRRHQALIR